MNRLIVPIIALLAMCQAQKVEADIPRLVLLLSVEELRSDLLDEIGTHFPDNGLKKLLTEGLSYHNVNNPLISTNTTATQAVLHTGTTAVSNGISSRKPYTRTSGGKVLSYRSVLHDDDYIGYATASRLSPKKLAAPTVSDKLWQASRGKSLIYSLASNAEEAIIAGGQHPNGVYWIDDYTGKWVSSTYYKNGYPAYIYKLNEGDQSPYQRLKTTQWIPLGKEHLGDTQPRLPYIDEKSRDFKHSFAQNGEGIAKYKHSGLINEELVKALETILSNTEVGQDDVPDLVSLNLFAGNYTDATQDTSAELIDTYYRLDRAVASILSTVERKVGLSKTLIVLSGNGVSRELVLKEDVMGYFHNDRCKALMNIFLIAQYGQGNWIEEVTNDGQIFLNRSLIETQKLNLQEIQQKAADFLLDFSGIQYAITDQDLRKRGSTDGHNKLLQDCINRATIKERGDIIFNLLPKWAFVKGENITDSGLYRHCVTPTTLVLRYPSIAAKKTYKPIDIRDTSSILCHILRIRPPTADRPLPIEDLTPSTYRH